MDTHFPFINYARQGYYNHAHYLRYVKYVESRQPKLTCQECGGSGGSVEPVLDDGSGPWDACGWCEGTGLVTPWIRGSWLQWKRSLRKGEL
jgi:hypothetical protein